MRQLAIRALLVAGLVPLGCGGGSTDAISPQLTGLVREPAPEVSSVSLPDVSRSGAQFAMRAEPGGLLLVFFGFTSCPDVCPTTLADLRTAIEDLPAGSRERVEVAMVSVDPSRDTPEVLTTYVQGFVPGAHALRTEDPAELRAAANAFGADYFVTTDASGSPEVTHTAWVYVVDDRGRLRVQWSFGTPSADMTSDLGLLLGQQPTPAASPRSSPKVEPPTRGDLTVANAWARRTVPGQRNGAVYLEITGGSRRDVLRGVEVDTVVAASAELHETTEGHSSGTGPNQRSGGGHHSHHGMQMKELVELPVPSGASIRLEPGGRHIMLLDLTRPLEVGQRFPLRLRFEQAGTVEVVVEVRAR